MNCANCKYNDGRIYTSIPIQYRCTITNNYHPGCYNCEIEFAPVRRAEWKRISIGLYECSNCKRIAPYYTEGTHTVYWPELNYCPYCGSVMEKEDE